jgi:hypothetical protein
VRRVFHPGLAGRSLRGQTGKRRSFPLLAPVAGNRVRQNNLKSGGSMIHPAIKVDTRARTPNPTHTRMMSSLTRSSLSDAHDSIALKIPIILDPHPQHRNLPFLG